MFPLLDDLRLAVRRLRHQPGFTVVAICTLALGLGANTAIFALIRATMLQALPVSRPNELYRLGDTNNCCVNSGLQGSYSLFSYRLYSQLRDGSPEFSSLAGFQATAPVVPIRLAGSAVASTAHAEFVSGNYFTTFGVGPTRGRVLDPSDDRPGAVPVFVMSHRLWAEAYAADESLIGRNLDVGGTPMTLVGIAAAGFFGDTFRPDPADLWIPVNLEPMMHAAGSILARADEDWLYAVGRLAPGVSVGPLQIHVTTELQQWLAAQTFLTSTQRASLARQHIVVTSAAAGIPILRDSYSQSLYVLFAMAALVLLIACANLANLLLARAPRGEAALRAALGASTRVMMRQSMSEGVVLALAGAAGALIVSVLATRTMLDLAFPAAGYVPVDVGVSAPILAFAVALAVLTGVGFSAWPAWVASRTDPILALRGTGRGAAGSGFLPNRLLVVAQVALSLVLLTGAGLLGRSLEQLEQQPLGFKTANRFVAYVAPPALAGDVERLSSLYAALLDHVSRIPGVTHASYSLYSPMEGNNWSSSIAIEGRPIDANHRDTSSWNRIGPDYFDTLGTRLAAGRTILATDRPGTEHVAVVNQAFAKRFFPDSTALDHHVGIGGAEHAHDFAIIGIVEDVKYTQASEPVRPMLFLPTLQTATYADPSDAKTQARSTLATTVVLDTAPGTTSLEPELRRALAAADPGVAVLRVRSLAQQVGLNFRVNRLLADLTAAYGLLALALASLGLYGVTAYGVSRRRREIGVRLALGATPSSVVREVLVRAGLETGVGLVVGLPLAWLASGTLRALLYGVEVRNPAVLALAALALGTSTIMAAFFPARRASAVNPTEALRSETP
jgi:predicted permease